MMKLNLPIMDALENAENILIAGAGGGFDVFCGLPIYFTLKEMGKNVHLANYSFSNLSLIQQYAEVEPIVYDHLIGATANIPDGLNFAYYPEGYLSQWFRDVMGEDVTVWMFDKTGPKILLKLYQKLIDHLNIDALILVDGGIDSVMIGDEAGAGTLLEDTVSLTVAKQLDIPTKLLACIGFGAELEVAHSNALANMASLVKSDAYWGSCSLVKRMPVYQQYESACRYVWEQPEHSKSQINMRIVSATQGQFGNHHLYNDYKPLPVFVTPLMSVYWFFDSDAVNQRSMLAPEIIEESSIESAYEKTVRLREKLQLIQRRRIQLPY